MGIVLTLIGIILFFQSLNVLGLIVSIIAIIISETLRKNNDSRFYSIASVLNVLYVARWISVLIIALIEKVLL